MASSDTDLTTGDGSAPGARRGRRRRTQAGSRHVAVRCPMCRQQVDVDGRGRCPLGHQVVTGPDARAWIAQQVGTDPAGQPEVVGFGATPYAVPTPEDLDALETDHAHDALDDLDTHDALETDHAHDDLEHDALPPTIPSSFSVTSPGFDRAAHARSAMPASRADRPQPDPSTPDRSRPARALPVMEDLPPVPLPMQEPTGPTRASHGTPAQPLGSVLVMDPEPQEVSMIDLTPEAPSVLDLGGLPAADDPTSPTFLPEPLVPDEPTDGVGRVLAIMTILVLVGLVGIWLSASL